MDRDCPGRGLPDDVAVSRRALSLAATRVLLATPLLLGVACTVGEPKAVVTVAASPSENSDTLAPTAQFELKFVRRNAPRCEDVWAPGMVLPAKYEWCQSATEGRIAGVRIGSCEVVVFQDRLYAVPGREIVQARGDVVRDPAFFDAMTSCKRKPFRKRF